jgi:hypothetical protein
MDEIIFNISTTELAPDGAPDGPPERLAVAWKSVDDGCHNDGLALAMAISWASLAQGYG